MSDNLSLSAVALKEQFAKQVQTALRSGVPLESVFAALRATNDELATLRPYLAAADEGHRGSPAG